MKKKLLLILCAALTVSLLTVGCASSGSTGNTSGSETEQTGDEPDASEETAKAESVVEEIPEDDDPVIVIDVSAYDSEDGSAIRQADESDPTHGMSVNLEGTTQVDPDKDLDDPTTDASLIPSEEGNLETVDAEEVKKEEQLDPKSDKVTQIVIFGDSQFGNFRDDSGAATWIQHYCKARVFNCAQGGTTAALYNEDDDLANWDSRSFVGMAHVAAGDVSPEFIKKYNEEAYSVIANVEDFALTDYFIVEYGVNDFMNSVPLWSDSYADPKTYTGALTIGIQILQKAFPKSKIILVSPNYAQFFSSSDHSYLGDGNILNNGYAVLRDYSNACCGIAGEFDNVISVDSYDWMKIWSGNAQEYLLDGIHLNNNGRIRFARLISRFIVRDEGFYDFGQAKVEAPDLDFDILGQELESLNIPTE